MNLYLMEKAQYRYDAVAVPGRRMIMGSFRAWMTGAAVAATAVVTVAATAPSAGATTVLRPEVLHGIAGWTETGSYLEPTPTADEGVTTVSPPGKSASELYRGFASIPLSVLAQGWTHIGDPDSASGYVVDAYQGSSSGNTKMYRVTTPGGSSYEYTHTLVSGELYNNSFAALTPNAQWMVSGEWDTMTHLQVYPAPYLNSSTSKTGGTLNLSGYIQLDHAVNDIQGCDFVTATELICSSDDSSETLFSNTRPLLEVQLAAPLTGGTVSGHVVDLGSIPQSSICSGTFEAEGVDYDVATGVLRVEIIPPGLCGDATTTVYEYTAS